MGDSWTCLQGSGSFPFGLGSFLALLLGQDFDGVLRIEVASSAPDSSSSYQISINASVSKAGHHIYGTAPRMVILI